MSRRTLARVTSYRRSPQRGKRSTLNYSRKTHAPDQTVARSQLIHYFFDLAAPSHCVY